MILDREIGTIQIFSGFPNVDRMRALLRTLTEIRHLVRRNKGSKGSSIAIRVCPVCFSEGLNQIPSFLRFIAPSVYYCESCGYKGPIFAEISVEPEHEDKISSNDEQTQKE